MLWDTNKIFVHPSCYYAMLVLVMIQRHHSWVGLGCFCLWKIAWCCLVLEAISQGERIQVSAV